MKAILTHSAADEKKHSGSIRALTHKRTTRARTLGMICALLTLTAAGTASALNINLTYDPDSTFIAAGLSPTDITNMKAAMTYAASLLTSRLTDPINVNVTVTAVPGTGTLGESNTSLALVSNYASLRAAMVAHSTNPDDTTALGAGGSLPATDPIASAHTYLVSTAQAKALGLMANNLSTDGTFTFGGGYSYTFDPSNRGVTGKIDFIGVATHELTEIMGRIGLMGQNLTGNPNYMQMDLFHYTGPAARGLNDGAGSFFSIDNGTTLLKAFNNAAINGGDLQDWASGSNDSFNAFSSSDVRNDVTPVDFRNMDAIGYNLTAPPLKIVSVSRAANNHTILQCIGAPNQVNDLQAAPDPSPLSFTTIAPAPSAADAFGAFQYDDAAAVGLTKRFYRVAFP